MEIKWELENDEKVFEKVDKNIIEDELNKLASLESEYLIITPSECLKNTNFIQVCNDADSEDEHDKFHIELSLAINDDEEFKIVAKDNLTKEEVLKIFVEYFENSIVPDITDWYEVEL